MRKVRRKVNKEFSDVQLDMRFFQVDPRLRDDWVEVRYDPFGPLETVLIYSSEGEYLGMGKRHQRQPRPNNRRQRRHPSPSTTISTS